MLNFKKIDYIVISVFILLEIALYLSFLFIDKGIFVTRIESSTLKYAGISLCLAFSLYCLIRKRKMVNCFIPIALVFTLISDYFLLFNTNQNLYVYGLITFIITQLIYFAFILYLRKSKLELLINLLIRFLLTIAALGVAFYLNYSDVLTILALVYFVELLSNFLYSTFLIKFDKEYLIFSLGLLLFIGCDINVGLNNVHLFEGIDYSLVNFLMWVFYLPSQVLLSLTNFIAQEKSIKLI